jgi:hypothetical protein
MTIKNATINDYRVASILVSETHGGQSLYLNFSSDMIELVTWWQEWKPVFQSKNELVIDALNQARTLHEITK